MLLLSEGEVDLEDFNDVMETSLSLLSTMILVSLASLMTSISESDIDAIFSVSTWILVYYVTMFLFYIY